MKKWQRILWYIGVVISVLSIGVGTVYISVSKLYNIECMQLEIVLFILSYTSIIIIIAFAISQFWRIIRRGWHNTRNCDDPNFEKIDFFQRGSENTKEYYLNQLGLINYFYSTGGKIDELVRKKDIYSLYKRYDYLKTQISIVDDLEKYAYSLFISILASFLYSQFNIKSSIFIVINIFFLIGIFFVVIFIQYAERGQLGSYVFKINEYEMKLLKEKIEKIEKETIITAEDVEVLQTKKLALVELRKIKKRKFKDKDDIIDKIKKCDLLLDDYTKYEKSKILINKKEACIYYDKNCGKAYNYVGDKGLANKQYSNFVNNLGKANLIEFDD